MPQKILIIGSSNTDMVVKTKKFPKPGETVLGGTFMMNPGGKGANQAVAAARLGADVRFVTKLGEDIFGKQAMEGFAQEGLDTSFIVHTPDFASGVALITVSESGENEIVVASGANMDLNPTDLPDKIFEDVEFVLVQLEIPMATVRYIIQKCAKLGLKLIINPAPASRLDDDLLKNLYLITPNETETEILTGIYPKNEQQLKQAIGIFKDKGIGNVIITLGKKGVFMATQYFTGMLPAVEVTAIDTTAAGDVYNGALVAALAAGKPWLDACNFAANAAAISVTRMGAQSAAPYLKELN